MAEFDDGRLRGAMRAYLRAADELDEAAGAAAAGGAERSRELIDKADAKTLAELALRKQLENVGWSFTGVAPQQDGDESPTGQRRTT